jgi:hypothetical protein
MPERTVLLNGFKAVVGDDFTSAQSLILGNAVSEARALTFDAHCKTLDAIKIFSTNTLKDALEKLCPRFLLHLRMNFRIENDDHLLPALHSLEESVRLTHCGLNSRDLIIRAWGLRKGDVKSETGAAVGGWVPNNTKDYLVRAADMVSPGGCLNVKYTNDENIVLDFTKLVERNEIWCVDTIIHEATHKYDNSRDFTRDPPWKRAWEYAADYEKIGAKVTLVGDWADLTEKQALHNAYSLTAYMHYMPDTDLKLFAATITGANRAIGNKKVFDSISNSDL